MAAHFCSGASSWASITCSARSTTSAIRRSGPLRGGARGTGADRRDHRIGLLLAIAGVTLILGVFPRLGVAALVLFLVPVSFFMHAFWSDTNPAARMADMVNFTKNMALLGSSLMFLAIPEPWPYSLGRTVRWGIRARV